MPFLGTIKARLVFLVAVMVLLTAGLVVVSVANLGGSSINEMKKAHDRLHRETLFVEWEEKAKTLTALLAAQSVQPVAAIDHFELNYHARLVLENRDVRYVYVLDNSGRVLSDGTKTNESVGVALSGPLTLNALAADGVLVQRHGDTVDVSSPIKLGAERLGAVRVGFSMNRIVEAITSLNAGVRESMDSMSRKTVRQTLLWTALVATLVLVLGYVFVGQAVSSPLRKLVSAAQTIGAGDLSHRVDIGTARNEISELGVTFNEMVGRLRETTVSRNLLEHTVSLLRATLDSTADGILVVDNEGRVSSYNRQFLEIWGIPPSLAEEGDDKRLLELAVSQLKNPDEFMKRVKELYSSPEEESFEILEFLDGRIVERFSRPQRLGGGTVGRVWSFHDITERKRAEDALRGAKNEAEEASRAKTRFLANMSHELRTPLNSIIGFSEMMSREMFGKLGNKKYHEYANDITGSGQLLLGIITDILDVAKVESGALDFHEESIDLESTVVPTVKLLQEHAREKNIQLSKTFPDDPLEFFADPLRVKQAVLNLLSNSIKFTPEGGRVTIEGGLNGQGSVIVKVRDTGIGIAAEDIPEVLKPFGRVDDAMTSRHKGSGLGLHLTKLLMEMHGGSLEIESEAGKGTEATLRFPPERTVTPSKLNATTRK